MKSELLLWIGMGLAVLPACKQAPPVAPEAPPIGKSEAQTPPDLVGGPLDFHLIAKVTSPVFVIPGPSTLVFGNDGGAAVVTDQRARQDGLLLTGLLSFVRANAAEEGSSASAYTGVVIATGGSWPDSAYVVVAMASEADGCPSFLLHWERDRWAQVDASIMHRRNLLVAAEAGDVIGIDTLSCCGGLPPPGSEHLAFWSSGRKAAFKPQLSEGASCSETCGLRKASSGTRLSTATGAVRWPSGQLAVVGSECVDQDVVVERFNADGVSLGLDVLPLSEQGLALELPDWDWAPYEPTPMAVFDTDSLVIGGGAGALPYLVRYRAGRFERMPSPSSAPIRSLAAGASGALWAADAQGRVYNKASQGDWSEATLPAGHKAERVIVDRGDDVWITGPGFVLRNRPIDSVVDLRVSPPAAPGPAAMDCPYLFVDIAAAPEGVERWLRDRLPANEALSGVAFVITTEDGYESDRLGAFVPSPEVGSELIGAIGNRDVEPAMQCYRPRVLHEVRYDPVQGRMSDLLWPP